MGESYAGRIGQNEALFRDINERIEAGRWPGEAGELVAFRCECGMLRCTTLVELTISEYESVRADSRRFVLAPGHELPVVEVVVACGRGHVVVEKVGEAGLVADRSDPRDQS